MNNFPFTESSKKREEKHNKTLHNAGFPLSPDRSNDDRPPSSETNIMRMISCNMRTLTKNPELGNYFYSNIINKKNHYRHELTLETIEFLDSFSHEEKRDTLETRFPYL